jgi:hypothetical protein
MAQADWTFLNDGLDIATVDRGVTAGIARPPGGDSFLYAFNSLAYLALRVPADVPTTLAWQASLIIDGTKPATFTARPGRTRTFTDLAANVSKLSGLHQVGVRLELVGV